MNAGNYVKNSGRWRVYARICFLCIFSTARCLQPCCCMEWLFAACISTMQRTILLMFSYNGQWMRAYARLGAGCKEKRMPITVTPGLTVAGLRPACRTSRQANIARRPRGCRGTGCIYRRGFQTLPRVTFGCLGAGVYFRAYPMPLIHRPCGCAPALLCTQNGPQSAFACAFGPLPRKAVTALPKRYTQS